MGQTWYFCLFEHQEEIDGKADFCHGLFGCLETPRFARRTPSSSHDMHVACTNSPTSLSKGFTASGKASKRPIHSVITHSSALHDDPSQTD
ncbi:MAG: hypothetical protein OXD44_08330 [Gammaproteobacteria bacterium]|nr:hypothetical protein [Gammaproteobacteria bacterium]